MNEEKYAKLISKLKKRLDEERFYHTLGVSYTSASLAMKYGLDINKARIAGLLHDCAKQYSASELYDLCKKNGIEINDIESEHPALLHSKYGAYLAEHEYGIEDIEILNAIRYHTTGRPCMSLLEKIVFVADYIEPTRSKLPGLYEIRKISFEDIDKAVIMELEATIEHLKGKSPNGIDPLSIETLSYYKEVH